MEAALLEPELKAEAGGAGEEEEAPVAAVPVVTPVVAGEEEVKPPPPVVSDEQIVTSLRALLATADMATTTGEFPSKKKRTSAHCPLFSLPLSACSRDARAPES
jgi:hypothetical protein